MEHLLDPRWEGTCTEGPASPTPHIAGNRLILDVYPDGCERFLQVTDSQTSDLVEVEFLRLSSNDAMITSVVAELPRFSHLRSLVLKGGHLRDDFGRCQNGLLSTLPPDISRLSLLCHLDLSFNNFSDLPSCVTALTLLTSLHLGYNQLRTLPDDIGELKSLTELLLMSNQLVELPIGIGQLKNLEKMDLSENRLASLPEEVGNLQKCIDLDLSGNIFANLPETMCNMMSLQQLYLHNNVLVAVPAGLANLPHLSRLDLRNNKLRTVPIEIIQCSCVYLQGNPIGEPEPSPLSEDETESLDIKELYVNPEDKRECRQNLEYQPMQMSSLEQCRVAAYLFGAMTTAFFIQRTHLHIDKNSDISAMKAWIHKGSFCVTPDGCWVFLPHGFHLCFPPGAVSCDTRIYYQILLPDQQHVRLDHHDVLLSSTLELQPHGIQFHQDVEINIPFASLKPVPKREVVIRTFNDCSETWMDLSTTMKEKSSHEMLASCKTAHFSWFLVVSRLVEDRCEVPKEGELLFSSVDQNIRVEFPPGATAETRTVRMQVLPVSKKMLQKITGESESSTSPLLCLSQSSAANFLSAVKIRLPLPPGVTGDTLDRSRLFLLHGDPWAQTWTDITNQVVLQISHIYANFQVDHFSWYWLWYTTKSYVGELAKNVYNKLRMYQVNFVALQRKRDPEQVLLQCVPKHKVESTVKRLQDRYKGPEPSDLVELVEGEQFFATFEQGLKLYSERPDCVDGRICFVFYSRMKNMKEVYVTSSANRMEKDVKGQVSFYRGSVPEGLPDEVTKHRKGSRSDWMATLPIKLPKTKGLNGEHDRQRNDYSLPPLNIGNPEMGYLTETNLLSIASQIGSDWMTIGINLGLSYQELERINFKNSKDLHQLILEMIFLWARSNSEQPDCVQKLVQAMRNSKRNDIADEIEDVITLGKKKYTQSIRRVGLDQGNSSEDSAIAMSQS